MGIQCKGMAVFRAVVDSWVRKRENHSFRSPFLKLDHHEQPPVPAPRTQTSAGTGTGREGKLSPTSLANVGGLRSGTKQRRAFLRPLPLHRRLAVHLARLSPPARFALAVLWLLLFWHLGRSFHSTVAASAREPGDADATAPPSPTTTRRVAFAPTQIRRTAARILFKRGTIQELEVPPLPVPSRRTARPVEPEWKWQDLWTDAEGEIEDVVLPVGVRLTYEDQEEEGDLTELEEGGEGGLCRAGQCAGMRRVMLQQDLLTGLRQMGDADPKKEMVLSIPAPQEWDGNAVTLVTQFSVSRLARFEKMLETWDGPLSLAIYLTDFSDIAKLEAYLASPFNLAQFQRLAVTVLKPDYTLSEEALIKRLRYPINRLRNLALSLAPSPFVLVTDVDFVPSPSMHTRLASTAVPLLRRPHKPSRSPTLTTTAIVVSAFQLAPTAPSFPSNLTTLRSYLYSHPPLASLTDANAGHGPSLPSLLFSPSASCTFEICYEPQWEPYYLLARSSHPLYDERFTDQGGDKQSHALLLNALSYSFHLFTDAWFMHPPKLEREDEAWPSARLVVPSSLDAVEEGSEKHFSPAQTDKKRWRYFEDFLPEMQRTWGGKLRWPGGCEARVLAGKRSFGRAGGGLVFGM